MENQIAPSDLQLFTNAQAQVAAAQNTLAFVQNHLGQVYQLTPADQVDLKTGAITRAAQASPAVPVVSLEEAAAGAAAR